MKCEQKHTYTNAREAKKAIKGWRAHGMDGEMRKYRCPQCKCIHLGHPTPRDKRIMRGLPA